MPGSLLKQMLEAPNLSKEYWIVDPRNHVIEQYWLQMIPSNEYALVAKWNKGNQIHAKAIEGFTIPVEAVFDKDACNHALRALLTPVGRS